jgi:ABC-type phosphate transport system substrate-binding protein
MRLARSESGYSSANRSRASYAYPCTSESAIGGANDFDQSQQDPELTKAPNVFAYKVQRTPTDPSSYPVLLVSYLMGCTRYDSADTTSLVKAYFSYVVSSDGQQAAAQNAGSAPLPPGITNEVKPAVDAIGS